MYTHNQPFRGESDEILRLVQMFFLMVSLVAYLGVTDTPCLSYSGAASKCFNYPTS